MSLLARLNDDHAEQVLYCVRAFTPQREAERAEVIDLQPGRLTVVCAGERLVIPLLDAESPMAAFEATALDAMKRLGVWPPRRVANWTVTDSKLLGAHFRRITLHLGHDDRSDWRAGDCCRFDVAQGQTPRPYTLRRVSGKSVVVDVYGHDDSAGSLWARHLQAGDTVTARGERHELFPNFAVGETWLLGDETALPTIAALLEGWSHLYPLRVWLQVRDVRDRAYLDDVTLPKVARLHWVDDLETAVQAKVGDPAAVWGAGEVTQATNLRQALKTQYPTAEIRTIGYWRQSK